MVAMDAAAEPVIRWAAGAADVRAAFAVRERVFCGEQGVPKEDEVDEHDAHAQHLVALDGEGHVIATLRLLSDGEVAKIGRVAVEREWRRRGLATRMLTVALAAAAEQGFGEARLAAQLDAVRVYEGVGFAVCSERFYEAGIPHVRMVRALGPGCS